MKAVQLLQRVLAGPQALAKGFDALGQLVKFVLESAGVGNDGGVGDMGWNLEGG